MCFQEFIPPSDFNGERLYSEVKITEYNDIDHGWEVYGWLTDDLYEVGRVIARIDPYTAEVAYTDDLAADPRTCALVQETISNFIKQGDYDLPVMEELQPCVKSALTALERINEILAKTKENDTTEGIGGRVLDSLYALQECSKLIGNRLGE